MKYKIENKNILITGGADGLGKQLINLLVEKNCSITCVDRDEEKLNNLNHKNIKKYLCDLRNLNETKYSSWTLDIDILYYDNLILVDDKIKIPRKEIIEYDFVLRPLIDIDAEFIHPVLLIPNNKIEEEYDIKKHIIAEVDINL